MLLLIVKYIHILAAIIAVGFNISYAVWIVRARRNPEHTAFALRPQLPWFVRPATGAPQAQEA